MVFNIIVVLGIKEISHNFTWHIRKVLTEWKSKIWTVSWSWAGEDKNGTLSWQKIFYRYSIEIWNSLLWLGNNEQESAAEVESVGEKNLEDRNRRGKDRALETRLNISFILLLLFFEYVYLFLKEGTPDKLNCSILQLK